MAGLRLQVREDLEKRFRETAMRRFGFGKGALTRAAEEAFERWLSMAKENVRFEGDPVKAIDGILVGMKLNSVELQHSVRKAWAEKVSPNAAD
jgi:hypothetical protein